jgi:hypothetical protein
VQSADGRTVLLLCLGPAPELAHGMTTGCYYASARALAPIAARPADLWKNAQRPWQCPLDTPPTSTTTPPAPARRRARRRCAARGRARWPGAGGDTGPKAQVRHRRVQVVSAPDRAWAPCQCTPCIRVREGRPRPPARGFDAAPRGGAPPFDPSRLGSTGPSRGFCWRVHSRASGGCLTHAATYQVGRGRCALTHTCARAHALPALRTRRAAAPMTHSGHGTSSTGCGWTGGPGRCVRRGATAPRGMHAHASKRCIHNWLDALLASHVARSSPHPPALPFCHATLTCCPGGRSSSSSSSSSSSKIDWATPSDFEFFEYVGLWCAFMLSGQRGGGNHSQHPTAECKPVVGARLFVARLQPFPLAFPAAPRPSAASRGPRAACPKAGAAAAHPGAWRWTAAESRVCRHQGSTRTLVQDQPEGWIIASVGRKRSSACPSSCPKPGTPGRPVTRRPTRCTAGTGLLWAGRPKPWTRSTPSFD